MRLKKTIALLVPLLLLAGCSGEANNPIKSIEEVEPEKLANYSGTYVGDNSNVLAIVGELAGAETFKKLDLRGGQVKVFYGPKEGSLPQGAVLEYWFDGNETVEKNFLYNAVYMSLLVPNAQAYEFIGGERFFSIKRESMIRLLSETFPDFPEDDAIWDQQTVKEFIAQNKENIEELVNSEEKRREFFTERQKD